MKIDIDKLSEDELIDLNNRIVARSRFLNRCAHIRRCSNSGSATGPRFSRKVGPLCLGYSLAITRKRLRS